MKKIEINIPNNSYNVYLGKGIFPKFTFLLKKENLSGNIFFVIDKNVKRLYPELLKSIIEDYPTKVRSITVESIEKNKSYSTLQKIHSALIKYNYDRDSLLVAIGGGIIGDITGFSASTYMRGIKYIQIPTTLLASVDSSVGGKTGINYENTKNIIGTFYQPELVIIDPQFFKTLPKEEMLCGIGEVVKYCFLTDKKLFNYVRKNINEIMLNNYSIIENIISEAIKYKGDVVRADEKESGIRKVLNLGHTFAHALEVEQKHKLKHGQAVIVGITCALYLSSELHLIKNKDFNLYLNLLKKFEAEIHLSSVDTDSLFSIMLRDKKNRNNQIKFVLLKEIGEIVTDVPIEKKLVRESISKALTHFK